MFDMNGFMDFMGYRDVTVQSQVDELIRMIACDEDLSDIDLSGFSREEISRIREAVLVNTGIDLLKKEQ